MTDIASPEIKVDFPNSYDAEYISVRYIKALENLAPNK